jgi:hypothetical protein
MKVFMDYDHTTGIRTGFYTIDNEEDTAPDTAILISEEVWGLILSSNNDCKVRLGLKGDTLKMGFSDLIIETEIPPPPKSEAELFKESIAGKTFNSLTDTEMSKMIRLMAESFGLM